MISHQKAKILTNYGSSGVMKDDVYTSDRSLRKAYKIL